MPSVLGFGAVAGRVPAEVARQPRAGFQLNIASAMRERHAFSTQMNRTVFSVIEGQLEGFVAVMSAETTPRDA